MIALVITIIVILILVAVVVATLTGENGILNRSTEARDAEKRGDLIDRVKLEIIEDMAQNNGRTPNLSTILGKYFTSASVTGADLSDMTTSLTAKDEYGGEAIGAITLGEVLSNTASTNTGSQDNPGTDEPVTPTGIIGLTDTSGTAITASSITARDQDFKIGDEQFKVINDPTTNGKVVAIPWYNLKLDASPIRQATEAEASTNGTVEGNVKFVDSEDDVTWSAGADIDMENTNNNVQGYITAYQATLPTGVTARIARYSEMNLAGMTNSIRNPGQKGNFWLGTALSGYAQYVRGVASSGYSSNSDYAYNGSWGVRPVIEFSNS